MTDTIIDCGAGFTNFRGSCLVGEQIEIGTHCSLVRRPSGKFVLLDSMTLSERQLEAVSELTDGGALIDAVVNLHPFHTLHVTWAHQTFPNAHHYGTARHLEMFPELGWESTRVEDTGFADLFADSLSFTQPRGVILIPDDDRVHFSSILAFHPDSGTLHSDDTLSYVDAAHPVSLMPVKGELVFHPALEPAMEPRAGAADAFQQWTIDMAADWRAAKRVATAHNAVFTVTDTPFPDLIMAAMERVQPVLDKHRQQFG